MGGDNIIYSNAGTFLSPGSTLRVRAFELRVPPPFDHERCLRRSGTLSRSITGLGRGTATTHDGRQR
jgi:hypothetical protein